MQVIKPSVEVLLDIDPIKMLKKVERCGRTCYKSEGRITSDSYIKFLKDVIARDHLSVIEHGVVTVMLTCDRGVTHEIVRHRIGSYSQESTRYVNYKKGIEVIQPEIKDQVALAKWEASMIHAENTYRDMIQLNVSPEIARSVLPNALKTEIAITFNLREWRHFFILRGSRGAHPQIREVAILILQALQEMIPVVFDDLVVIDDGFHKLIKLGGE